MIRGVSSITISVCAMASSDAEKILFRIGIDMIPGKPVIDRRSSSCRSPASRCDSPSRSRSFVVTLRVGNDGASCPPTRRGGPSVSFDMTELEQDVPFVGDEPRRRLDVDADGAERVRRQRIDVRAAAGDGRKRRRQVRLVGADFQRRAARLPIPAAASARESAC